jgi:hypothetical protein
MSTAVHCVTAGHAKPVNVVSPSILTAGGLPGPAGLNMIAFPPTSTAVHCVAAGHDTPTAMLLEPIEIRPVTVSEAGLVAIAAPLTSIATHALAETHDSPLRATAPAPFPSIVVEPWPVGPNVSSPPPESTTTHWLVDGHAIASGVLPVTDLAPDICPVTGLNVSP